MRRWTAILLALLLWAGPSLVGYAEDTPSATPRPYGETSNGTIRVWLQSLGERVALGLSLDGIYSVDGDRGFQFAKGTEIAVGLDGGHVVLSVGGATIDMGGGFTLKRHLNTDGSLGGAYIHEGEKDTLYNGDLAIEARNDSLRVIVTLEVEEYLYGVVPYEMSDQFPLEALKAQSVAARTYALMRRSRSSDKEYDVSDTTSDQVFKGYEPRYALPIQAVNETKGIVGMYEGRYAECLYSASNGGQTALASDVWGGETPYFDMRDDPYDLENTESIVKTTTLSKDGAQMPVELSRAIGEALSESLIKAGTIAEGEVVGVDTLIKAEAVDPVYGGESRQYGTIRFTVKPNVRRYTGDESDLFRALGDAEPLEKEATVDLSFYDVVRQALGIGINASKYDLITVEETEEGFLFTNRRYGHGVGLSQRGAEQMANAHDKTFLDILHFYYPGLELVQMDWAAQDYTMAEALPESLGYAAPRPTAAPTPAPLPPLNGNEYYATIKVAADDGTLRVREGPSTEDKVVTELRNGARLIVVEETNEEWVKMKTVEVEGYVMRSFLEKE